MRLDLIVTTLNRQQKLRALLASLEAQTRRPDRIIVVDQSDEGLCRPGDIIGFPDDDCTYPPDAV